MKVSITSCLFGVLLAACGGDDDKPCDPIARTGCDDGLVCEQVSGGEPACFAPVQVRGRVLNLAGGAGIAGARVVAVDVNGAAASGVAVSGADGSYSLEVPAQRDAEGNPSAFPVSLRADASGFQSFPGTVRQALPLDVATAADVDGTLVVKSSLTDIGLFAQSTAGSGSIKGRASVPDDHAGVLVVAESGGKGHAVIAARDGDYQIFNLPAAHYTVTAYALGHAYAPAEVDVASAAVTADLALSSDAPATLTGQVSIVNGGGGTATSVVAFVESTFDPVTGRGVPPPGLRAPRTGVPNVSGAFTIDGVPPGRYVLVAAFENDALVRDPDQCISGTDDVHVQVTAGATIAAPSTFKVTGALAVMAPGATGPEAVTGTPTFRWADDSGETGYVVEVFDTFGQRTWMTTIAGVSGGTPSVAYAGPALTPGMYYQFRVTSTKQGGSGPACELSRTEDLRGVFFVP
ncbi:MAG: hypothetical protein H0T46_02585 [Deltaproteobacteria bacterium]|nr:hypothetical protein [Deltaproteobacteria bacterium]